MSPVQNEERVLAQDFKAGRPLHVRKAGLHSLLRDREASFPKHFHNPKHRHGVVQLILSQKRQAINRVAVPEGLSLQRRFQQPGPVKLRDVQRTTALPTDLCDDLHHFRIVFIQNDVRTGLDDPRLRAGNFCQSTAEILCVLKSDVGDHGDLRRVDHIGRVKFSSEPHFQYHNVTPGLFKIHHSDRCDQLELAGVILHCVCRFTNHLRDLTERFLRDIFSADLDPLPEILDIGRRKEAGLIPGFPQYPLQHRAGRSLAVGAGHMHEFQLLLRISEPSEKLSRPVQAQSPLAPCVVVDGVNRLLNCHLLSSLTIVS